MNTTGFKTRLVVFCILLLGCAFATLLGGCATTVEAETKTAIAAINPLPKVDVVVIKPASKPEIEVKSVDGVQVPTLTHTGMRQLIDLYRNERYAVQVANAAQVSAHNSTEFANRMLELAKAEESSGNLLRKQLADEQNARSKDNANSFLELNITRALAAIALIAVW